MIESTGFRPRCGPLAAAVWASVPVPKSVRRTAARARTGARPPVPVAALLRVRLRAPQSGGRNGGPSQFFHLSPRFSPAPVFLVWIYKPGQQEGKPGAMRFQGKSRICTFSRRVSPPLVLALLQAVAAASSLSLFQFEKWFSLVGLVTYSTSSLESLF